MNIREGGVVGNILSVIVGIAFILLMLLVVNSVAAPVRWCKGIDPKTGKMECRQLRDMMGEKQCPAGYVELTSCPENYGTVEVTPVPTEPPEPPEEPTPSPTPSPTPTTAPEASSCDPVHILRWANVTPEPVGVVLTVQAGNEGGELWTPNGKRVLLPRELVHVTASGGIAVGAGLADLRGTAVHEVGGREVLTTLPVELLWPCAERR